MSASDDNVKQVERCFCPVHQKICDCVAVGEKCFKAKLVTEQPSDRVTDLMRGETPPVIGPFPAQPLAAVAALPSKDDPAKLEVQYCLAQAIAADFVEVIVIGTRSKAQGGGFTWFGSSQEVLRAIAMMEVAKAEMVRAQLGSAIPNQKPPGAA